MDPYNSIKDGIITGKYGPGMRLTEEFLANELKVSRTPIREAIKQLESEGLITPLKRGVIVRKFTKDDIRQIYDLRALLESYAASQASYHRTEEDIEKMIHANEQYKMAIQSHIVNSDETSIHKIVKQNQVFHEAVLTAAKNDHLRFHISKVVVIPLVFRSFYWYSHEQMKHSYEIHQSILETIKNQESERAKVAMQEHIYQGRDHVLKHLTTAKQAELRGEVIQ